MPFAMVTMSGMTPSRFKAPEMRAQPAKTGLHFIGDAYATCGARRICTPASNNLPEIPQTRQPPWMDSAMNAASFQPGVAVSIRVLSRPPRTFPGVLIVVAKRPAIRIRRERMMHAETVRHVVFPIAVRRQANGRPRHCRRGIRCAGRWRQSCPWPRAP